MPGHTGGKGKEPSGGDKKGARDERPLPRTIGVRHGNGGTHVLLQRKLRSFCTPQEARGNRPQERLHHRNRLGGAERGLLSGPRRADARQPHPHPREGPRCRRRLRRRQHSRRWLRDARRPRDGQPFRGHVGPSPLHPFDRGPQCHGARRILLAQQGRPQLLAVPSHREARPGRPHRRQVRPVGQGGDGDHAALLHA